MPHDLRAALAALAAAEPEQPGLIFFHEHQGRWRWHPWRWLHEAVGEAVAVGGAGDAEVEPHETGWPSVEALLAAIARFPRLDGAAERAAAALQLPATGGASARPIALLAADPGPADLDSAGTASGGTPSGGALARGGTAVGATAARAWLAWALGAGAALVLPAGPGLLAWSLAWTRPSHASLPVAELAPLREALLADASPRALRRRLRRLRHLLVWGGPPDPGEVAAWAELGVAPVPWRAE